jgi:predicted PurR-regulated permease PerM
MSTTQWQRLAVISVCACAAVLLAWCSWLAIGFLAPVLGLFFGGWLLACLQEPLVGWIARRSRASRSTAVAVSILAVGLVLGLVAVFAAPALEREVSSSLTTLPAQLDVATERAHALENLVNGWLAEHGLPLHLDLSSGPGLDGAVQGFLGTSADPTTAIGGALNVLGRVGTMLLLSVFFLLGGPQLAEQITSTFVGTARADVQFVLCTVHDSFEGFVRAQLVQSALFGLGVWACLGAAGVEQAPLVGALAGVVLLVPMVGAALGVALPLVATGLWNPAALLWVGGVLVVLEQLVLNVVGPRLMSRQTGLPPLVVLFGILAGGQVAGFWGAVFGIPVLATLLTCVTYFRTRWAA